MAKTVLDGKTRLPVKVADVINDQASILHQVLKGSKSSELLGTAARNFALQEAAVENSYANLKRMSNVINHLNSQVDTIRKSVEVMSEIQDRMQMLEKTEYWNRLQ